jgi:sirohydrochlorin ferrochelatase
MGKTSHAKTYVMIAHGSRETKSNRAFLRAASRLAASTKKPVIGAFLELAPPSIPEALETAVRKGAREIVVIPLMLFPGRHAVQDIPALVRETARRHPKIRFRLKKALAFHPRFLSFLKEML